MLDVSGGGGGGGGGVLEISVLSEVRVVVVSIICFVTLPTIHTCFSGCLQPCTILPCWGFYFYHREASH